MPSQFFNPADHLLDLVSVDPRASAYPPSSARVSNLTDRWKSVSHKPDVDESAAQTNEAAPITRGHGSTRIWVAMPVVLERHWKNLWRRKDVSYRVPHSNLLIQSCQIFFNRLVQTPLLAAMFILFFQRLSHGPTGDYLLLRAVESC